MMEDVFESVTWKLLEGADPSGTDLEGGWILKYGYHRKNTCISVQFCVYLLANQNPPWSSYHAFITGHLNASGKPIGVRLVGTKKLGANVLLSVC